MKKAVLTIALTIISTIGFTQIQTTNYYEFRVKESPRGGGDEVFIAGDKIYIPERKESRSEHCLKTYSLIELLNS